MHIEPYTIHDESEQFFLLIQLMVRNKVCAKDELPWWIDKQSICKNNQKIDTLMLLHL